MIWWNTCVWTGLSLGQQSNKATGYSQGQSTELLFHGCVSDHWHMSTYKNAEGGKYAWENELSQHWKSKTFVWVARMGKIIVPVNWWEVYSPRNHLSWGKSECKGDEASYPLLGCYWSSPALLTLCSTSQLLSPPLFHIILCWRRQNNLSTVTVSVPNCWVHMEQLRLDKNRVCLITFWSFPYFLAFEIWLNDLTMAVISTQFGLLHFVFFKLKTVIFMDKVR